MAYIYYCSGKHVSVLHNQDVYLLGNAYNYHEDNTIIVDNSKLVADSNRVHLGWLLVGDVSMTIGGIRSVNDLDASYTVNTATRTYNIFQQNVTGMGHSEVVGYSDMKEYSAVHFAGNGTVNLSSQSGAAIFENYDNTISIFAKNTSVSAPDRTEETTWELEHSRLVASKDNPFLTGNINTDSNAIKADGTLIVNTAFKGKLQSHSRAYSHGFYTPGDKPAPTNSANNMSNKASGFRGQNVIFKNNIYGDIATTARVSFASFQSRVVSNNSVGSYGIYASNKLDLSKCVWSGRVLAQSINTTIDASEAYDAEGKIVDGNANADNNIIQATGLYGNDIVIGIIDSSYNWRDGYGANIQIAVSAARAEKMAEATFSDTTDSFETVKIQQRGASIAWDATLDGTDPDTNCYYFVSYIDETGVAITKKLDHNSTEAENEFYYDANDGKYYFRNNYYQPDKIQYAQKLGIVNVAADKELVAVPDGSDTSWSSDDTTVDFTSLAEWTFDFDPEGTGLLENENCSFVLVYVVKNGSDYETRCEVVNALSAQRDTSNSTTFKYQLDAGYVDGSLQIYACNEALGTDASTTTKVDMIGDYTVNDDEKIMWVCKEAQAGESFIVSYVDDSQNDVIVKFDVADLEYKDGAYYATVAGGVSEVPTTIYKLDANGDIVPCLDSTYSLEDGSYTLRFFSNKDVAEEAAKALFGDDGLSFNLPINGIDTPFVAENGSWVQNLITSVAGVDYYEYTYVFDMETLGGRVTEKEKLGFLDPTVQMGSVLELNYEVFATSGDLQNLFGISELLTLNDFNNTATGIDRLLGLCAAVVGKGHDVFFYEEAGYLVINADVVEINGTKTIEVTDSNGVKYSIPKNFVNPIAVEDPLHAGTSYNVYAISSSAFTDVADFRVVSIGQDTVLWDVNGEEDISAKEFSQISSVSAKHPRNEKGELDASKTNGISWVREFDLNDISALKNTYFYIPFSYKTKSGDKEITVSSSITKSAYDIIQDSKNEDSEFTFNASTNTFGWTFGDGTTDITLVTNKYKETEAGSSIIEIDTAKGMGGLSCEYDPATGSLAVSMLVKGENQYIPGEGMKFVPELDDLKVSFALFGNTGSVSIDNYDLLQGNIKWNTGDSIYINGDWYYQLDAIVEDEQFEIFQEVDNNAVVTAKVLNNTIQAKSYASQDDKTVTSLVGNRFEAIGVDAANKLVIGEVTKDTLFDLEVSNNAILDLHTGGGPDVINNNQVNAIGIRGKEITLSKFNGTISAVAKNNDIATAEIDEQYTYYNINGIKADKLNVTDNLGGVINVEASDNGGTRELTYNTVQKGQNYVDIIDASELVGGIIAGGYSSGSGDITVQGVINTTITVDSMTDWAMNFGIAAYGTLAAEGFAGSITVNAQDAAIGILAYKYAYVGDSNVMQSSNTSFEIGGTITVSGMADASMVVGVASVEQADLVFSGTIISNGYAIKTDYTKSVQVGYSNDVVTFKNGSNTYGVIDLGGGVNQININSGAYIEGHVAHSVGNNNIVFYLNEHKDGEAIFKVVEEHDTSFTSGKIITLDFNNAVFEKEYIVYEYNDSIGDVADKLWESSEASVNILFGGFEKMLVFQYSAATGNYSRYIKFDTENGGEAWVLVKYDASNNQVIAKISGEAPALAEQIGKIYAIAADIDIDGDVDEEETAVVNGEKVKLETQGTEYFVGDNGFDQTVSDNLVANMTDKDGYKFISDVESNSAMSQINLIWAQEVKVQSEFAPFKKFEITYRIIDAAGNVVSENVVQVDSNKDNIAWGSNNDQTFYTYKYALPTIVPDGHKVEWSVQDITNGREIYDDQNNLINTVVNSSIDLMVNSNTWAITDLGNMKGVNIHDETKGINTSMAKLSWESMDGKTNYAIDYYTVRYFICEDDLTADDATRNLIFNSFDQAKAIRDEELANEEELTKVFYIDKDGNLTATAAADDFGEIVFGDHGEVQVKKILRDENGNAIVHDNETMFASYNFYEKITTANELLVTGLVNRAFVYWQIQGTDTSGFTENNQNKSAWFEGVSFRSYNGDVDGPVFDGKAIVRPETVALYQDGKFRVDDLTWDIYEREKVDETGAPMLKEDASPNAKDGLDASGTTRYVLQYKLKGSANTWTGTHVTSVDFSSAKIFDVDEFENGKYLADNEFDFVFDEQGIYEARVVAVDAAGNYGIVGKGITEVFTIVAQDTKAATLTVEAAGEEFEGEEDTDKDFVASFTWSAIDEADASNLATGIDSYTITYTEVVKESMVDDYPDFNTFTIVGYDEEGKIAWTQKVSGKSNSAGSVTWQYSVDDTKTNRFMTITIKEGAAANLNISSYSIHVGDYTWDKDTGDFSITEGTENLAALSKDNNYTFQLSVTDKVGNVADYKKSFNWIPDSSAPDDPDDPGLDPDDPDNPDTPVVPGGKDTVAPSGKVLGLNAVEVKVTKRAEVTAGSGSSSGGGSSNDGWFESIFGINSGSSSGSIGGGITGGDISSDGEDVEVEINNGSSTSGSTTTTTPTDPAKLGKAIEAEVTFSWTDNYTDASDVRYIMQVSDSDAFLNGETYTFLVVKLSDGDSVAKQNAVWELYNKLKNESYPDLRLVMSLETKSENGVNTNSVVFDNSMLGAPVGLFSGLIEQKWRVTAVDIAGNMTDGWTGGTQDFHFVDMEKKEIITDTGLPAVPNKVGVSKDFDSKEGVNTGAITLTYDFNHLGFGVDYSTISIKAADNSDGMYSATYSIDSVVTTSSEANANHSTITVKNAIYAEAWRSEYDGEYVVTVTNYGANGKYSESVQYTFTQDTERPFIIGADGKIQYVTDKKGQIAVDENGNLITAGYDKSNIRVQTLEVKGKKASVSISWDIADDRTSEIKEYIVKYRVVGSRVWNEIKISHEDFIKNDKRIMNEFSFEKEYQIQVVAVDTAGNRTAEATDNIYQIMIDDKNDLDAENGIYDYDSDITDGVAGEALDAQLVGGLSNNVAELDVDKIRIVKDANVGEMKLTVRNLTRLYGKGNSLTFTVRNELTGAVVKTFTVTIDDKSSKPEGVTYSILMDNYFNESYIVEVKSNVANTVLQYGFEYKFETYATIDEATKDNSVINKVGQVGIGEENKIADEWVGYGDSFDYYTFDAEYDGKYTFTLEKSVYNNASNASLKLYIYQVKAGATTLTSTKTVTMNAADQSVEIKDLLLAEGQYLIKVEAPNHTQGANIHYDLLINGTQYAHQNNADDFFMNDGNINTQTMVPPIDQIVVEGAGQNVAAYDAASGIASTFEYVIAGEYPFVDANSDGIIDGVKEELTTPEWVGYNDMYGFKEITIDQAGNYTFGLYKDLYSTVGKSGNDGAITMTLYSLNKATNALTSIKSVTVAANAKDAYGYLTSLLDKGTYYLAVSAPKAASGDSIYYFVGMYGDVYTKADGTEDLKSLMANNKQLNFIARNEEPYSVFNSEAQYIGFGEADNYWSFSMNDAADLKIDLYNRSYDAENASAISLTLYKYNETGTGLTVVKTFSVAANASNANATIANVAAGNYVIKVNATNAAVGKSSMYDICFTLNGYTDDQTIITPNMDANSNNNIFANAKDLAVGAKGSFADNFDSDYLNFYKFETGDKAGKYSLLFENAEGKNLTYTVYYLKDGATALTQLTAVTANKALETYLDANTTYYIGVNNGSKYQGADPKYTITEELTQDMAQYAIDNDIAALKENSVASLAVGSVKGDADNFDSWVGYGDLNSWRKLEIANGGSFDLSLDKKNDANSLASALTVTLYKLNANGTTLTSYKTLSVAANVDTKVLENILLEAGDYYVKVTSSTTKGYAEFNVSVENNFVTQADDNNIYTKAAKAPASDNFAVTGWVGYGDEYDYYNISGADLAAGKYAIKVNSSDAVSVTLYALNTATGALTSIKSVTIAAANFGKDVDLSVADGQLLNGGNGALTEYIVAVKSTNAASGGNANYTINFNAVDKYADITSVVGNTTLGVKDYAVFTIINTDAENTTGIYSLVNGNDGESSILSKGVTLFKLNEATGALTSVALKSELALTEGTYYLYNGGTADIEVDFKSDEKSIITKLA